jgi:hypothetical protein
VRFTGVSEDRRSLEDANGRLYPIRAVAIKLADTTVRTVGLVLILFAIGLIWEAFH